MIHVNIASISKHIEELRSLLSVLNHPFDIIGITGTRIHDETPPVNIDIEGYELNYSDKYVMWRGRDIHKIMSSSGKKSH